MSTGNDIVALAATNNARTSSYRFFSRILSPHEQHLYSQPTLPSLTFSEYVWLLWSIKESAYKYCSRSNPALGYAPLMIPVDRLSPSSTGDYFEGLVCYQETRLYSRSWLTDGAIATVVSEDPHFRRTRSGVHRIGRSDRATQSALVREFALRSLSELYPDAALRIVKSPDGPPVVHDGETMLDIPISLAHHDHFVAWSYRVPANNRS
jgi:hypothetical protein